MPNTFDRWWEPRRADESVTAEFLGRVLDELGATDLAKRARLAHFDDYFAPPEVASGFELMQLVVELERWARSTNRHNRLRAREVIKAVKAGEFDGTTEESARWEASKDGQEAMATVDPKLIAQMKDKLTDPAALARAKRDADEIINRAVARDD